MKSEDRRQKTDRDKGKGKAGGKNRNGETAYRRIGEPENGAKRSNGVWENLY
ncbi:MAG: hypothetical protein NTX36_13085 [Proteobacteria bacterium]|nr:hypothetical protein [Pseudomonadota bacterium]